MKKIYDTMAIIIFVVGFLGGLVLLVTGNFLIGLGVWFSSFLSFLIFRGIYLILDKLYPDDENEKEYDNYSDDKSDDNSYRPKNSDTNWMKDHTVKKYEEDKK